MNVHVFSAPLQPATNYVDDNTGTRFIMKRNPHLRAYCYSCGRCRTLKNMVVQVYYDCTRFLCKEGHYYWRRRCWTKEPDRFSPSKKLQRITRRR